MTSTLEELANEHGIWWPGADSGQLRTAAALWRDLANTFGEVASTLDAAAEQVYDVNEGDAVNAFEAYWCRKWTAGDGYLPGAANYCNAMAQSLEQFAGEVDQAISYLELLVGELITVGVLGTAAAFVTFGLSEAGVAEAIADAVMEAADLEGEMLRSVLVKVAEMAIAGELNVVEQTLQQETTNPGQPPNINWLEAGLAAGLAPVLEGAQASIPARAGVDAGLGGGFNLHDAMSDDAPPTDVPDPGAPPDDSSITVPDFDPDGFGSTPRVDGSGVTPSEGGAPPLVPATTAPAPPSAPPVTLPTPPTIPSSPPTTGVLPTTPSVPVPPVSPVPTSRPPVTVHGTDGETVIIENPRGPVTVNMGSGVPGSTGAPPTSTTSPIASGHVALPPVPQIGGGAGAPVVGPAPQLHDVTLPPAPHLAAAAPIGSAPPVHVAHSDVAPPHLGEHAAPGAPSAGKGGEGMMMMPPMMGGGAGGTRSPVKRVPRPKRRIDLPVDDVNG